MLLPGTPSDEVADVLATGNGDITTTFVSMATRHPDGTDAQYLQWHTLDHRPEQHRLSAVRASLRLVSTPACRAARAVRHKRFDPVDHVMTYFFSDAAGLDGFLTLSAALGGAGRKLPLLPPVERGVYGVRSRVAAARVKVGADVLPWWPARGVYLLLETRAAPPAELAEVEGVGGVWSMGALDVSPKLASARAGQQLSYCFLDDDPVVIAARLRPVLEKRWNATDIEPLFAAPFHPVVPHEWSRYVP
jgi:hypothetical protein